VEPRAQFAANLKATRHRRQMSQEALGRAADLHATEISRLERAKREPRLMTVVRLARALDVSAADLVKGVS
jgi:transcriptional regulator with XRE-family HTH domain